MPADIQLWGKPKMAIVAAKGNENLRAGKGMVSSFTGTQVFVLFAGFVQLRIFFVIRRAMNRWMPVRLRRHYNCPGKRCLKRGGRRGVAGHCAHFNAGKAGAGPIEVVYQSVGAIRENRGGRSHDCIDAAL